MAHTLLLADDSTTIQRLVELTFAKEDIDVILTADGLQAIATLAHTTPDIVLADVGMPGRDGYEVTRHIKQTPALAHVPVLLLTGAFEPVDADRAREVGSDGVMTKPFEPQAMVERVKELLARHAPPTVASGPRPADAARLDDYFASLDEAIQSRIVAPASGDQPPPAVPASVGGVAESSEALSGGEPGAPLLAGAFSALLAAEQSGDEPDAFAEWLPEAAPAAPPATAPAITEDVIEQIVERVLARLPDRVVKDAVREAAAAITSSTAERLVLEEIERIKSHIK